MVRFGVIIVFGSGSIFKFFLTEEYFDVSRLEPNGVNVQPYFKLGKEASLEVDGMDASQIIVTSNQDQAKNKKTINSRTKEARSCPEKCS